MNTESNNSTKEKSERPAKEKSEHFEKKDVALFVTCLVDLFRPSVGFASLDLLEQAGCKVSVPNAQTCCGQPAYNSGDRATAQDMAKQIIAEFEAHEYIVAPSGSCAAMLKKHVPLLLADDANWADRSLKFSSKVYELVSFLVDICGMKSVDTAWPTPITYHDSCSGLRELDIQSQPRALIQSCPDNQFIEMAEPHVCCGFGGTFCVKYPDISNAIVEDKIKDIQDTKAQTVAAGDLGCLMNMAGKLSRENIAIEARHIAEILVGDTTTPAIIPLPNDTDDTKQYR